ncbi:MAG: phage regulatory CII family protein [Desulfatiglandales bacterium]
MMDELIDLLDAAAKRYPIKALASELLPNKREDKAESTLRGELNRQPGHKLGLVTAILIMKKTGDLQALDRIETMFNRVAFVLPPPIPNSLTVTELLGRMTREFGEHMQSISQSIRKGTVTRDEARRGLHELTQLMELFLMMQAHLEALT